MQPRIKTTAEIAEMRTGGKILGTIFQRLRGYIQPGMTEREINDWVEKEIHALGATPTYKEPTVNFPGVVCISTNDKVVHGVPTDHELQIGDVVGFDLVITYNGMKTDSAFTVVVGEEPRADKKRLLEYTERSLYDGISIIRDGVRTGDIGVAIQKTLQAGKLGIVREMVGHGIGHEMHEAPDVPNYGMAGQGQLLKAGMTIAIEPMATLGRERIKLDRDNWTLRTRDRSLAAHFEHTVLITQDGYEILTQL
ncbi:MAG TPA: type I methionyl aminopeptidase [Verrucomicrobiae bacterium]|nr:type I methionyl aminopeptidase [Verrucomicrobiae bacterium]